MTLRTDEPRDEFSGGGPTFLPSPTPRPEGEEDALRRVWRLPPGIARLTAVNNSSVGVWYIATALLFFLIAGVLALVMRLQLAVPDNDLLDHNTYNQFFTVHGTGMMFLFAVPIVEAIGVYLLPSFLAARDLPFPRLSAFAFWAYFFGGIAFFCSLIFGAAPDGGWFMYPPLTSYEHSPGINADFWLLGIGFIEISAIAGAIEIVVGILRTRPPGKKEEIFAADAERGDFRDGVDQRQPAMAAAGQIGERLVDAVDVVDCRPGDLLIGRAVIHDNVGDLEPFKVAGEHAEAGIDDDRAVERHVGKELFAAGRIGQVHLEAGFVEPVDTRDQHRRIGGLIFAPADGQTIDHDPVGAVQSEAARRLVGGIAHGRGGLFDQVAFLRRDRKAFVNVVQHPADRGGFHVAGGGNAAQGNFRSHATPLVMDYYVRFLL